MIELKRQNGKSGGFPAGLFEKTKPIAGLRPEIRSNGWPNSQ